MARLRSIVSSRPLATRLGFVIVTAALSGCAVVEAPTIRARKPHPEKRFLVSPLSGFSLGVLPDHGSRLRAAHAELVDGGVAALARGEAEALREEDPLLEPAVVLLAQVEFVDGNYDRAVELLLAVVASNPSYVAAQLLLGRTGERIENIAGAFESYFEIASVSTLAADRATALRGRALEIVGNRVADALRRGRTEDATRDVLALANWAPGELVTLEAARGLAQAVGDREGELKAARMLVPLLPENKEIRIRLGDLELETGDPSAGLRIFQQLAEAEPQDALLVEKLARAKLQWRLTLMPGKVLELVRQPQLSRADFAAVVYWLFPVVRYGQADSGRIANDILDNPHRQEIVRMVNLGLARVDATLHTFGPDQPQTRGRALYSLLRLLDMQTPRLTCLGPEGSLELAADQQVCDSAARCLLIREPAECLPGAVLSGPAAFDMSRSALDELGIE